MSSDSSSAEEAALELTLFSVDNVKASSFLAVSRPFAVAWVDSRAKKSVKSLSRFALSRRCYSSSIPISASKLHFPLSIRILRDPTSTLTIQILAQRPFGPPKNLGTSTLVLSSARLSADTFVLPLIRSSGRQNGTIRIAVRTMWCLGSDSPLRPPPPFAEEEDDAGLLFTCLSPTAPPLLEVACAVSHSGNGAMEAVDLEFIEKRQNLSLQEGGRKALKSFFIGLVGGLLATVIVGTSCISEM